MKNLFRKITLIILTICLTVSLSACFGGKEAIGWGDLYGDNTTGWGDAVVESWDGSEQIQYFIESKLLFEDVIDGFSSVECVVFDYKSNAEYFDDEALKAQLGSGFDVNSLVAKFAAGTGVIVVCVMMNIITAGTTTPFACFIAGAAKGSVYGSLTGAAMGAATNAVMTAITTKDWNEVMYKTIEGAVDGYMWGAIFGAITGGLTSEYCFAAGTKVKTINGYTNIEDVKVGDYVWSYNESSGNNELKRVANTFISRAQTVSMINTSRDTVVSSTGHKYYKKDCSILEASKLSIGTSLKSFNIEKVILNKEEKVFPNEINLYNFEVEDNHNYFVGVDELLVHNRACINSEYAGKIYKFERQYEKYLKTQDPNDLKIYQNLINKYPDGVPFSVIDKNGNTTALFEKYVVKYKGSDKPIQFTYDKISKKALQNGTCLVGDSTGSSPDFKKFWQSLKETGKYTSAEIAELKATCTIHHAADMRTLQLIPRDLHEAVKHTGGGSFIREQFGILINSVLR